MRDAAFARVLARTMKTDHCWLWLGSRNTKGYGEISVDNRTVMVHRLAYTANVGPIAEGLVVGHTCHDPKVCVGGMCVHRLCVNPAHLSAVTNEENLRRQSPAMKTHCVNGHERTPENLVQGSSGRHCRPCRDAYMANYERTPDASLAREWARANGYKVGVRGRLSSAVMAAYERATAEALPARAS